MTDENRVTTFDVLRLLPEEQPQAYLQLPEDERAWRGRYFLMVTAMGSSEEYAWFHALNRDAEHVAGVKALVERTPDYEIVEALKLRAAERQTLPADGRPN
jgi:hypothetical protein